MYKYIYIYIYIYIFDIYVLFYSVCVVINQMGKIIKNDIFRRFEILSFTKISLHYTTVGSI